MGHPYLIHMDEFKRLKKLTLKKQLDYLFYHMGCAKILLLVIWMEGLMFFTVQKITVVLLDLSKIDELAFNI